MPSPFQNFDFEESLNTGEDLTFSLDSDILSFLDFGFDNVTLS